MADGTLRVAPCIGNVTPAPEVRLGLFLQWKHGFENVPAKVAAHMASCGLPVPATETIKKWAQGKHFCRPRQSDDLYFAYGDDFLERVLLPVTPDQFDQMELARVRAEAARAEATIRARAERRRRLGLGPRAAAPGRMGVRA